MRTVVHGKTNGHDKSDHRDAIQRHVPDEHQRKQLEDQSHKIHHHQKCYGEIDQEQRCYNQHSQGCYDEVPCGLSSNDGILFEKDEWTGDRYHVEWRFLGKILTNCQHGVLLKGRAWVVLQESHDTRRNDATTVGRQFHILFER